MVSEEEKKEYEELKSLLYRGTISQYGKRKLIDIIEKQFKEIEALKLIHETYKEMIEENNYISKDKIKEKIQELEKQDKESKLSHNYLVIPVLQELLEE